jgi:hypothetical protein
VIVLKVLVPTGLTLISFKDFWEEMKGDVVRLISEFHRKGKLTKGLNSTFIALIPKVESPERLNDFRPISLVGSLYKILTKVLANKLIKGDHRQCYLRVIDGVCEG